MEDCMMKDEKLKEIAEEFRKNDMLVKDTQIQIRINSTVKAKAKYLAEVRGYKSLSDYICYLMMQDISESEFINKQMIKEFEYI